VTRLRIALAAAVLISCGVDASHPSPSASTTAQPTATSVRLTADDDLCARQTFERLIAAVNAADETRLKTTMLDPAPRKDALDALVAVGRSGETWTLKHLDVNGRGWHGGVDFGVEIRRSGPRLPTPFIESAGKGVLDCPAERVMLFGLGYGRVPRGADPRS